MYILDWGQLTPALFLQQYWQKKPLLIKNAFPNFIDPLSADELAGLAMEEEIESRLIIANKHSDKNTTAWDVRHGPFNDFDQLPESGWTLLVQAVNHFSPECQTLLAPFNFIANWRLDDIMVSFSTPEGGVGPHLDQYDVFIIQGEGKRRWQIGEPDEKLAQLIPHPDLKQVSHFNAIIDEITEPGDLLYIPPMHPHNGSSINNSLNYSIGFQAPNNQELWSNFADKLLDDDIATERLSDADRTITTTPELLSVTDINKLKTFMHSALDDDEIFNQFIGSYLTKSHHNLDLVIPTPLFQPDDLIEIVKQTELCLIPVCGIKSLYLEQPSFQLIINGEAFSLDCNSLALGKTLAQGKTLTIKEIEKSLNCLINIQLLTNVLNKGFWYIE